MDAIIKSIRTSIDGGFVISFDIPENEKSAVKLLLDMLNKNVKLTVEL